MFYVPLKISNAYNPHDTFLTSWENLPQVCFVCIFPQGTNYHTCLIHLKPSSTIKAENPIKQKA